MTIASVYKKLLTANGPWALIAVSPEEEIDAWVRREARRKDASVHIVRGQRCQTKTALLNEWAAALQFPSYFGANWDAFEDCLNDLEWLPGTAHVVVISNTLSALAKNNADWKTFVDILQSAAEEWRSRKGMLRCVFHVGGGGEEKLLRRRFKQAGVSL
jgi:hypothetical protein